MSTPRKPAPAPAAGSAQPATAAHQPPLTPPRAAPADHGESWGKAPPAPGANLADPVHMRRARIRALEDLHATDRLWIHGLLAVTGLFDAGSIYFWQGDSSWPRLLLAVAVGAAVVSAQVGLALRHFRWRLYAFSVNVVCLALMVLLSVWVAWDLLSTWPWSGRFYSLFLGALLFGVIKTNPWNRVFQTEHELRRLYHEEAAGGDSLVAAAHTDRSSVDELEVAPGWDEQSRRGR